ncbi:ABC-type multidrug transport system, ATPase component [Chitinophaga jiangningensis]|uniref:ABC-type multidrug transport system, ATPase component n=1 Tax=Chitinophaga jiangningensis TaxID=1419482 RepID=A0A1M7AND4_9BACT|nr:ABC transporter ATP-binding protein [Chitinophaga jiangningensis]SHL44251.1 ABC-type multidrug transport system, ATPase component [Chitinophaga jiangningensis]
MDAVVLDGITKTYAGGKILAVDNVSLTVKPGELFGLIGPDGAGKTSIFRMLTTLLLADKGTATVQGLDVVKDYRQIRKILGYMPGKFSLYQDLTVHENLTFFATLFGTTIEENYDIIRDIYEQLKPFSDRRAGKLSGGMKQKLALCCALIHKPEVLFLDEPTTGVDVVSRREFWDILARLKNMGITILVSTPYMDEASLCERIALIQAGSIMQIDTPDKIVHSYPVRLYAAKSANIYGLLKDMRDNAAVESCFAFGEYLHLTMKQDKGNAVADLEAFARQKGHTGIAVKEISPGIEDTFIRLMNQKNQ